MTFKKRRETVNICVTWGKLNAMLPGTTDGWVLRVKVYLWLGEVLTITCLKTETKSVLPVKEPNTTIAKRVHFQQRRLDVTREKQGIQKSPEGTGLQISFPKKVSNSTCRPSIRSAFRPNTHQAESGPSSRAYTLVPSKISTLLHFQFT